MMHPHPLPSPLRPHAGEYLTAALSHKGRGALSYGEDWKWLVRTHLLALMEVFPSLTPSLSSFTHNDGQEAVLLKAEGTIPAVFGGAVYHLPAAIWLLESYPLSAPSVFLLLTPEIAVVPGHKHADPSGHVSVPYLHSWAFPTSNLVDLVRSLSDMFGKGPPLYTLLDQPISTGPASASAPSPVFSSPSLNTAEAHRRDLIEKLVEKVRGDVTVLFADKMEGLLAVQATLRRREGVLNAGLSATLVERDLLEQRLQELIINTDVLGRWLADNRTSSTRRREGAIDFGDMFDPCNGSSRQLLECKSEDLTTEDTYYALERGLQADVLPFQSYLKNVRALAREQFFCRALEKKIATVQAEMRLRVGSQRQLASQS